MPLFQNFTLKVYEGYDPVWSDDETYVYSQEVEEVKDYKASEKVTEQSLGEQFYAQIVQRLKESGTSETDREVEISVS